MELKKRVSDSYTEQVQIVAQKDLNGFHRLFGGRLMEWIDTVAAVVARRHSNSNVITAMVDTLQFRAGAHTNEIIVLQGKITYVGKTSMEVCVRSYVENADGERHLINKAYFIMVAMDENEKPTLVPGLELETDEERLEWEAAQKRYALRSERRREQY